MGFRPTYGLGGLMWAEVFCGFPLQVHYMLFRCSDTIDFKWVVHVGTTWDLWAAHRKPMPMWAHLNPMWCGLGGLTWAWVFFGLPMWAPHGIYMGQMGSREQKFSVGFPLQAHYMLFRCSDTIDFKWVVHVGTTWDLDGLGWLTWACDFCGLPMWAPHGIYMG